MQVTIDIPETLYRNLEAVANVEKTSVPALLLENATRIASCDHSPKQARGRIELPLIPRGEPGPLMREDTNLNHVAWMDDNEINELLAGR